METLDKWLTYLFFINALILIPGQSIDWWYNSLEFVLIRLFVCVSFLNSIFFYYSIFSSLETLDVFTETKHNWTKPGPLYWHLKLIEQKIRQSYWIFDIWFSIQIQNKTGSFYLFFFVAPLIKLTYEPKLIPQCLSIQLNGFALSVMIISKRYIDWMW